VVAKRADVIPALAGDQRERKTSCQDQPGHALTRI
jgi:hypothetical protein